MEVEHTAIEGLLVLRSTTHRDDRGFFRETYRRGVLEESLGRPVELAQGNHSRSLPGALRGFHAEPWDKLVYVARGTALAAVADVRPGSATFGEVHTRLLGDEPGERLRLFVAQGLANAFCAVTEVDYVYDVGEVWRPGTDKAGIAHDDPDLAVAWPVAAPRVSDADLVLPRLRERFPDHPRWRA